MPQCAMSGCTNSHRKTKGGSVRYHRFPGDEQTRARWIKACGRHVPNCATARVCSRHFTPGCYERDVQHELLGLPTRCRLKKGAVPDCHLPYEVVDEEANYKIDSAIAVLLAVGLVPAAHHHQRTNGGLPQDLNKMHVIEDVHEACDTQPSSPGHAEQRDLHADNQVKIETSGSGGGGSPPNVDEDESTDAPPSIKKENGRQEMMDNDIASINNNNNNNSPKRKSQELNDQTTTSTSTAKKLKNDHTQELYLRNKILNEYTDALDMSNFEQVQQQTEQLLLEIQNLNDLAKEKEREWNNVIHLKKMKEELLLRIQRQKQVCLLSNGLEISESGDATESSKRRLNNRHRLVKSLQNSFEMNGQDPKLRQRPVRDVQSIIADYRQRHPETVPRRGRRIRTVNGADTSDKTTTGGILKFSNMALGSGSQVKQNVQSGNGGASGGGSADANELNLLLSAMESVNQESGSSDLTDTASFKDILMQFAKLSQSDRQELLQSTMKPPPPYPEVTVHPVATTQPTNSLLHGILTKAQNKNDSKSAFSPTLARLLTAPERNAAAHKATSNVSISDILSTNKARNEITITPVGNDYENSPKRKNDDEEAEDSVDRLVIDESGEILDKTDNNSDGGDEVPQCQGCQQKAAQFVCAGCGNQWYCSRECQVSAWDEHSEVCSG